MRLEEQFYFSSGDLENLSSSVMYSSGFLRSSPLVNTDIRGGRIETIFPKIDGLGTLKVYIDPFNFKGKAGYQKKEESHKEYAKRMEDGEGVNLEEDEE